MISKPKQAIKKAKLVKAIVEGKTLGEAGMIATGSKSAASGATQAARLLKYDDVQEALAQAFEEYGIDIKSAVAPIGKALLAKKVENGQTVDDLEMQLKGSDRALRLMLPKADTTINFHFSAVAGAEREVYEQ